MKIWVADPAQPLGADFDDLAVDPQGNPAFVAYQNKLIYHKKNGQWTKMDGCSYGIAFERDGTMIRQDCDYYLHRHTPNGWKQISDKKGYRFAAGDDGLWIMDQAWKLFRLEKGEFVQKGNIKPGEIAVGFKGQVMVKNYSDNQIYTYENEKWVKMDDEKVSNIAIGCKGRMYKIVNSKVFKQINIMDIGEKKVKIKVEEEKAPVEAQKSQCSSKDFMGLMEKLNDSEKEKEVLEEKLANTANQTPTPPAFKIDKVKMLE